jgi:hypothetical protein
VSFLPIGLVSAPALPVVAGRLEAYLFFEGLDATPGSSQRVAVTAFIATHMQKEAS